MKSSFIILCCFITGILLAYYRYVPDIFLTYDYSNYILPVMMFFVGIGIGGDIKSLYVPIKKYKLKIILIPLATIFGSIIITALISPLFDITTKETIAIGSGFGYYSLSAIFLNKLAGYEIGMMALISNMTREITALLFIPILARYCGKLAPISAAGATSIDPTVPIIAKSCGEQFIVISIFHGILVDISVPIIISLLYYF